MSELLANVRRNQSLLIPTDDREITSFEMSLIRPMGLKRSAGKRSFIDSVLDTLDDFYADVVQHLREWQPPAPKMERSEAEAIETEPDVSGGCGATEPIDNAVAGNAAVSSDSAPTIPEPKQGIDGAGKSTVGSDAVDAPMSPESQ